jgi:hypothetical protein
MHHHTTTATNAHGSEEPVERTISEGNAFWSGGREASSPAVVALRHALLEKPRSHEHTIALILVAIRRSTAPASLTAPWRNDRNPRSLQIRHANHINSSPSQFRCPTSGTEEVQGGTCLFKDLLHASVVLGRAFCARNETRCQHTGATPRSFPGERPGSQLTEVEGSSYSSSHSETLRRGSTR